MLAYRGAWAGARGNVRISMLHLFYSNRHETLAAAMLDHLAAEPLGPWDAPQIVVPSAALRRRLELDIAARDGVCAQVRFSYLAQWLWEQIGRVLPVPARSPFAPDRLVWRCYRLFTEPPAGAPWLASPRLAAYLQAADAPMRLELAQRVARLFDHYLTYRPEWLAQWQAGASILSGLGAPVMPGGAGATPAAADDERWQAALWRALSAELSLPGAAGAPPEPPAQRFLREVRGFDLDTVARARWPASVSVFAVPTMPPLHIALLRELSRWIEVRIYALNPCREFWFDIVTEARAESLDAAGRLDYQQVGHPLLADWGRQTQAQLHLLHELTEGAASTEASAYTENPAPNWLARVQNAMLDLTDERDASGVDASGVDTPGTSLEEPGIEVHVCHSLARQLEVLHDRLLACFDADPTLRPSDVLVALPDLAAAAPLIDAVFGASAGAGAADPSGERTPNIPYRITGLPPAQANPVARVLLEWLGLPEREVGVSELVEWLRVDAIAARYGIDAAALETVQTWLAAASARRGLGLPEDDAGTDPALPATPSHTLADALLRLYLGYAMPDGAAPLAAWLPVAGAAGGGAELLGRLARFADDLERLALDLAVPRTARAWRELLGETLARCFDAGPAYGDALGDLRDALDALCEALQDAAPGLEIPAAVLRAGLQATLDDPARGGVPWGGVTFSSLSSLRGLPYRMVCLLGMDDGVLPSLARADEFDLMARYSQLGDRQRRADERNLFLELLLGARERMLIAYTGRSVRDNAPLPPAALVDELLDHLAEAAAGPDADPQAVAEARRGFVTEHPLQPFSPDYVAPGGALATYDAAHAALARRLSEGGARAAGPFFPAPLPPETEQPVAFDDFERFWRHPARALLRDRLGIALGHAQAELSDLEPYALDYAGSDALAARVLPLLTDPEQGTGTGTSLAQRMAAASPELPGGATGTVWRAQALGQLEALAADVRGALADGTRRQPFALEVEPQWPAQAALWFGAESAELARDAMRTAVQLYGTLNRLGAAGQVIYRYARPGARDYLSAWLAHLVYCAIDPGGPRRTLWFGRGAQFALTPVAEPLRHLAPLLALYRAGRRVPLRFFPKSAWSFVKDGEARAESVWRNEMLGGELDDSALALAWRGAEPRLDEGFQALAALVFEPLREHLEEERA